MQLVQFGGVMIYIHIVIYNNTRVCVHYIVTARRAEKSYCKRESMGKMEREEEKEGSAALIG